MQCTPKLTNIQDIILSLQDELAYMKKRLNTADNEGYAVIQKFIDEINRDILRNTEKMKRLCQKN